MNIERFKCSRYKPTRKFKRKKFKKGEKKQKAYYYSHEKSFCKFCGLTFPENSLKLRQHVITCLSDHPTLYQYPERGSCYYWRNKKNVIPEPFIAFADFEAKIIPISAVCDQCDAKILLLTDEEEIDRIVASCNHRKIAHRSCAVCTLEIKSRLLAAVKKCDNMNHIKTTNNEICEECYKVFEIRKEQCIHKELVNINCDGCLTSSDFCKHHSSEKVKKFSFLHYFCYFIFIQSDCRFGNSHQLLFLLLLLTQWKIRLKKSLHIQKKMSWKYFSKPWTNFILFLLKNTQQECRNLEKSDLKKETQKMLLKNVEKTTVNAGFAILMSDITTVWWTTVTPRASNFNLAFIPKFPLNNVSRF